MVAKMLPPGPVVPCGTAACDLVITDDKEIGRALAAAEAKGYKRGLEKAAEMAGEMEKECEREMKRFAAEGETIGSGACFQQVLIVRRLFARLRALAEKG